MTRDCRAGDKKISYIDVVIDDRIYLKTNAQTKFTLIQRDNGVIIEEGGEFVAFRACDRHPGEGRVLEDGKILDAGVKKVMSWLTFEVIL